MWRALCNGWTWKMAWRDSRAERGRLVFFGASMFVGVGAMAAIHALRGDAETALALQEKALLGSDVTISSRQPFSAENIGMIQRAAHAVARESGFASMLYFPEADGARLVQVRAFEGGYPFYGTVETEPEEAWDAMHRGEGILAEPALLAQFGVVPGDLVRLGDLEIPVAGVIRRGLPRSGRFGAFAPEIYLSMREAESTGLLGGTALASHALHVAGSEPAVREAIAAMEGNGAWRVETPESRREMLGDVIGNFRRFLSVLSMSAVVLGAIGVASAIHAHIARRVASVAVMRCLGAKAEKAVGIYVVQAFSLGVAAAVAGAGLGAILHRVGRFWIGGVSGWAIPAGFPLTELGEAAAMGVIVCMAFAWLPLGGVRRVPPALVLRSQGGTVPLRGGLAWRVPVVLVIAFTLLLLGRFSMGDWFGAGIAVVFLGVSFVFLWLVAKGLVVLARWALRPSWPYVVRQGVANLFRPGNQTVLFLLSLGTGAFLLMSIVFTAEAVARRASISTDDEGPSLYLVDLRPDQVPGAAAVVDAMGLPVLETAPMVIMRIDSVRGEPVSTLRSRGEVPGWILQREFRSTHRSELNPTERIVAGQWPPAPAEAGRPVEVSVERDLAADLGLEVGDAFGMNVQGMVLDCVVGSLREVDWSRFNLNFFMIFPPGILEGAPGFHVLTTRVSDDLLSGRLQRAVALQFPNVSVIDLSLLLERVREAVGQIVSVVGILALFSVFAGGFVLAGALWNSRDARLRESALLRVLGASRRQIRSIVTVEYLALGLLSGLAGAVPALLLNGWLCFRVFRTGVWPSPVILAAGIALCALASLVTGLLLGRGASDHSGRIMRRG